MPFILELSGVNKLKYFQVVSLLSLMQSFVSLLKLIYVKVKGM
jgi:hypothetical protein